MNENQSRKSMSSSADNRNWRPICTTTNAAIVPITTGGTLKIGSEAFTWKVPLTAPDRTAASRWWLRSASLTRRLIGARSGARPSPRGHQLVHRLIGELGFRAVSADHEHQNGFFVRIAQGDVFKAASDARGEGHHVQRSEIDIVDCAFLILPTASPGSGHWDECFVGVVIVHHRTIARLRTAITEIEALRDLDRRKPRRVITDRRGDRATRFLGRLKSDHIIERPNAALHPAVRKPAVGTLQLAKTRHALHHIGA